MNYEVKQSIDSHTLQTRNLTAHGQRGALCTLGSSRPKAVRRAHHIHHPLQSFLL